MGEPPDGADDRALDDLIDLLRGIGVDAADFRRSALRRRVLACLRKDDAAPTLDAHVAALRTRPDELRRLADRLSVHVTRFFRDAAVFEALERDALPRLATSASSPVRAWSIGVATGAEAYTLGMLLAAARETTGRAFDILASEPDRSALEAARTAVYPAEVLHDVPPRFRRFLVPGPEPSTVEVARPVREGITFVEHDLREPSLAPREAIVASFDLVLCRNVLMYLDDRFRLVVLRRLAAVVRPGGALLIGHPESLPSEVSRAFVPFPGVDPGLRLYARTRVKP